MICGRWDVFSANVLLVAEEARARWRGGVVREERVERRVGMPGRGVQVLKRAWWAVTCAVQAAGVRGRLAQDRSWSVPL